MCVIIIKQKKKQIDLDILMRSAEKNPHGLGIVWLDTYHISFHKSEDYKLLLTSRPFIAHFRLATIGGVSLDNRHPFKCGNTDEWLMQNGTIYGLGNKKVCDTKVLAGQLSKIPRHHWKNELSKHNCRFVSINTEAKTFERYNKADWYRHDGVWYSKDNVLLTNYVAVYGTLKYGHGNYYSYLSQSKYIDSAETIDRYPLIIEGLPYMVEQQGLGYHVDVDVFAVSDAQLKRLDSLEGHPNWYQRKEIEVRTLGGDVMVAWVYFNPTVNTKGKKFHKTYEQSFYRAPQTTPTKSKKKKSAINKKPYIKRWYEGSTTPASLFSSQYLDDLNIEY